jgi:predicted NAD/FAD-dependent oxidoreductase
MNKIYDYVIVGTGPTGLGLAWYLAKENKTVLLIDKETTIGGCHRVQRVNGLLTEHGPRVYSNVYLNFINLLTEMNINFKDLFTEYSFDISNIGNKTGKDLHFNEIKAFVIAFIKLIFNPIYGQNISMKTFMNDNSFSPESIDYLERVCRLTDGAQTDRYTLFQFLQLINNQSLYKLYQPTKPTDDGLLYLMQNKLMQTNMVTFLLNHEVLSVNNDDSKINNLSLLNKSTSDKYNIQGNKYILAIPPKQLTKLLLNSSSSKYAFGSINFMKKWTNNNSYFEYIPITLHWKKKLELPKIWGFPASDWGLAFIVLSNYMKFNREIELENSQTVISTAITFTDRKSNFTKKTANESNMNEIYDEVLRQLRLSYPDLPKPDFMLTSPQVYRVNDTWLNADTAFVSTPDKNQYLPFKSSLFDNLYTCGAHNGKSNYHFTSMETAISNALYLFNIIEPNGYKREIKEYKQITNFIKYAILLVIFVILYYIYSKKIINYYYN